ncbi:hypothetical protein AB0M29_40515 [Streptomyces sp. NPDC051976]|uniref:hypothetical protein n=1 Tax=Streptomyces sp. NPDC051976 TaxID=3154947 RepID=UPI003416F4E2
MNRTSVPIAGAVTASVLLLLTACGGGGSDTADHIQPSAGGKPSASSNPTPSSTQAGAERPSTALPKDLKLVFDWPKTGDPTKDAVFADAAQYVRAYNRAAASHDLKDPAYQFYSRDQGLTYAHAQITANIDGGWAPTGVDHYYRAKVTLPRPGSATLTYCRDQTKAYSKNVATGKVHLTTPSDSDFVLYNVLYVKDASSKGVWQASHVVVIEKATQCKR